jgi:hypothetical protein
MNQVPSFVVGFTLRLKRQEIKRVKLNSWNHLKNTLKVMYSTHTLMSLLQHRHLFDFAFGLQHSIKESVTIKVPRQIMRTQAVFIK